MLGFIIGFVGVQVLLDNRPRARRGVAEMIVAGEDLAVGLARGALRASQGLKEDWDDIVAEARERADNGNNR